MKLLFKCNDLFKGLAHFNLKAFSSFFGLLKENWQAATLENDKDIHSEKQTPSINYSYKNVKNVRHGEQNHCCFVTFKKTPAREPFGHKKPKYVLDLAWPLI